MKRIAVTGGAGRIGRAVLRRARAMSLDVLGIDVVPDLAADSTPTIGIRSATVDIRDTDRLADLFEGIDGVIHCAGLHAPHVGRLSDDAFRSINVEGTESVLHALGRARVPRLVLSSSTALLGGGSAAGEPARWIDQATRTRARTIYHETKLAAEERVRDAAGRSLRASIVRLGRCFPEEPRLVAFYRMNRGISERDAAGAHLAALGAADYESEPVIACATTPFRRTDAAGLGTNARDVVARCCPDTVAAFTARGWSMPQRADRVYDNAEARERWNWQPGDGALNAMAEFR